jgi:repressor LexA
LLVSDPTKARTLRLVQNSDEDTSHWGDPPDQDTSVVEGIPIEGAIAAGEFIHYFSTQTEDGKAFISPNQFSPRSRGMYRFALRVRGDSMIGAHILDGDIVIFDKPNNPQEIKNKTIVAARIVDDDQTTLKRWHRQGSNVFLIPENPDYPEIRIHISEVLIEGVYVGLVRDMF